MQLNEFCYLFLNLQVYLFLKFYVGVTNSKQLSIFEINVVECPACG